MNFLFLLYENGFVERFLVCFLKKVGVEYMDIFVEKEYCLFLDVLYKDGCIAYFLVIFSCLKSCGNAIYQAVKVYIVMGHTRD